MQLLLSLSDQGRDVGGPIAQRFGAFCVWFARAMRLSGNALLSGRVLEYVERVAAARSLHTIGI